MKDSRFTLFFITLRTRVQIVLFCVFMLNLSDQPLRAETLKELAHSEAMRNITGIPPTEDTSPKWFKADSNYRTLFLENEGGKLLVEWIGLGASEFRAERTDGYRTRDFAQGTRSYALFGSTKNKFSVEVIVPHPRSSPARSMGLLSQFKQIEDKFEKADEIEKIKIRTFSATLAIWQHDSGQRCGILVPIAHGGLVQTLSEPCSSPAQLIKFTDSLDFERLINKLES